MIFLGFIVCFLFMCSLFALFDEPKPKKTKEQEQIEKQQKQIEKQRRAWKRNIRYMK